MIDDQNRQGLIAQARQLRQQANAVGVSIPHEEEALARAEASADNEEVSALLGAWTQAVAATLLSLCEVGSWDFDPGKLADAERQALDSAQALGAAVTEE